MPHSSDFLSAIFFSARRRGMLIFDFAQSVMPLVKCPHCGKEVEFSGNEFRPFCSERCKLLDFGAWADEEYALPAETSTLSDEDVDKIEKALEEGNRT